MSYINTEIHTIKIDAPSDIAKGIGGEPAFVVLRTRAKNKTFRAFTKLNRINSELSAALVEIQQIDTSLAGKDNKKQMAKLEAKIASANKLREQADQLVEQVYQAYIYFVVNWNWLDIETGEPLPKPDSRQVFEDELSPQQIYWIRERIEELKTYRATEGNAKTSTP